MSSIKNCCLCCKNPLFLGCFSTCLTLDLGLVTSPGTYVFLTEFEGRQIRMQSDFLLNEIMSFDISELNDNYLYNFQLLDSKETPFCYNHNEVIYDCLSFRTSAGICTPPKIPSFELFNCDCLSLPELCGCVVNECIFYIPVDHTTPDFGKYDLTKVVFDGIDYSPGDPNFVAAPNLTTVDGYSYPTNIVDKINTLSIPQFEAYYAVNEANDVPQQAFGLRFPSCKTFELIILDEPFTEFRYTPSTAQSCFLPDSNCVDFDTLEGVNDQIKCNTILDDTFFE